jgi:hypothetical protein
LKPSAFCPHYTLVTLRHGPHWIHDYSRYLNILYRYRYCHYRELRLQLHFILIHCCPSYERSTATSKAISPQIAIYCFLFQFPVSSIFLKVSEQLLTSSSSSSRHFCPSLHLPFHNVFQKAVSTQSLTNPVRLTSF